MLDLRKLERRTFKAARDDGLFDVMMAAIVSMFALAPLLSEPLGDFWGSAVFGPFWYVTYLVIGAVRTRIIAPRVGTAEPGPYRRGRLRRVNVVLLIMSTIALGLGTAVGTGIWVGWLDIDGYVYPLGLGAIALAGLTLVAYANSTWRYSVYGLLLAAAPPIGEWLWRNDLASHHGFPLVFGGAALIILTTGLARLASLLRHHPVSGSGRL